MEHFARWVVRHRKAVLAAAVLLLIPSVFGAAGTYINYDILTYLPPELDSMVGRRISGGRFQHGLHLHDHRGEYVHRGHTCPQE